ncbi:hypothetical protein H4W33_004298 [Kibdelosporangium phytohabitans]|nr:hypothetical protein [Kibdelosporangium phytohabitans]
MRLLLLFARRLFGRRVGFGLFLVLFGLDCFCRLWWGVVEFPARNKLFPLAGWLTSGQEAVFGVLPVSCSGSLACFGAWVPLPVGLRGGNHGCQEVGIGFAGCWFALADLLTVGGWLCPGRRAGAPTKPFSAPARVPLGLVCVAREPHRGLVIWSDKGSLSPRPCRPSLCLHASRCCRLDRVSCCSGSAIAPSFAAQEQFPKHTSIGARTISTG